MGPREKRESELHFLVLLGSLALVLVFVPTYDIHDGVGKVFNLLWGQRRAFGRLCIYCLH